MTNPEPPDRDPGRGSEPTTPAQRSAESDTPTTPTTAATPAAQTASTSGAGPSGQPVPSSAGGGPFARFRRPGPAATTGAPTARRWPRLVGGAAILLVTLLVGALIGVGVAHHHARAAAFREYGALGGGPHGWAAGPGWGHGGQPGHGRFGSGPMGGHQGFGGHQDGFGGHRGGFGAGRAESASVLLGSVTSVTAANLAVMPDGAAQPVTVPTNDQTRVAGTQSGALTDLKAGDRVAVRLGPDRSAVGVLVVPATAAGTVTTLNGTTATLTRANGLTQPVDTSALTTQPKVGDRIAVRGTASGGVLKAQSVRTLPKAS